MIAFVEENIWKWIFAFVSGALTLAYRALYKKLKEEQKRNSAIADGVQALLRESIVSSYNKHSDKGFMPIYAKESIKKAYKAYSELGGNDVASELYRKMLQMKEEPDE